MRQKGIGIKSTTNQRVSNQTLVTAPDFLRGSSLHTGFPSHPLPAGSFRSLPLLSSSTSEALQGLLYLKQITTFATSFCWVDHRPLGSRGSICHPKRLSPFWGSKEPSPCKKENLFNPHKKPVGGHCLPHYRRGNWGWERLSNFPRFAQVVNREPRFESPFVCLNILCFFH